MKCTMHRDCSQRVHMETYVNEIDDYRLISTADNDYISMRIVRQLTFFYWSGPIINLKCNQNVIAEEAFRSWVIEQLEVPHPNNIKIDASLQSAIGAPNVVLKIFNNQYIANFPILVATAKFSKVGNPELSMNKILHYMSIQACSIRQREEKLQQLTEILNVREKLLDDRQKDFEIKKKKRKLDDNGVQEVKGKKWHRFV